LDNLELDEDVKKIKQLKAREQSAETQQKLPLRLRVFEKFPNHPQMVSLKRVGNDFDVPKIRESFMRQFLGDDFNIIEETSFNTNNSNQSNTNETNQNEERSTNASIKILKNKKQNKLPCITENPIANITNSSNSGGGGVGKNVINLNDLNNSGLLKNRKLTNSNANTAKLKILNNIRMQRACRFSMKKMAINNIIKSSNNQRLFNNDPQTQMVNFVADTNTATTAAPTTNQYDQIANLKRINRNRDANTGKSMKTANGNIAGVKVAKNNQMFHNDPTQGLGGAANSNIDFKLFQYKRQQAELKRNQLEDDLKENHPYFDKPLFTIGRESNFRKFCQMIVEARFKRKTVRRDLTTTQSAMTKDKYKKFYKFLGLVSYLDWIMIAVTIQSCIGMMFETPTTRLVETWQLKIVEYLFVIFMSIEMILKVCAYGFLFTPNAVIKDFGGILDLFIYTVSLVFLYLSPDEVVVNSGAQILMLLRCLRPLRIFTLVPHMRKVIYELCRGFKEILLVSILIVALIFVFANYGIQIFGGKLARCNDVKITDKKHCTGMYKRNMFVSKLKLGKKDNVTPAIWVPRVWSNPYNFNFDSIGNSMLALFEVLSLEGWLEVRDVIIERMGTVILKFTKYVCILIVLNYYNY
jgi:sodium leak channel non-selective protein